MATIPAGSPPDEEEVPVGAVLARLRRRARLTGQELGRRTGMSQAKISKIETGAANPSPEDVERIARELGASQAQIDHLVQQAEHSRNRMTDWRVGRRDPTTWQHEIAQLEADAHEVRVFQPAVISGLLQTSEYARAVLLSVQEVWTDWMARSSGGVAEAVSARVQRQEILEDPAKQFHFVVPETLLRNLLSRPEDMPGQLRRLSEVAQQDNVTLSMIPEGERWPYPPYHGFSLLDDRHVIIDLFNTVVVTDGQSDIRLYRHVFDTLESRAKREIDPIIEKYRQRYLRLAAEE
ncbi:MAG TPA: helix-turn-helix transcriptional regulator [Micromonosporaceae bacterium]|nr:helix-turn-helix transcriptional regulator [Micromonosporaceae bacterium]